MSRRIPNRYSVPWTAGLSVIFGLGFISGPSTAVAFLGGGLVLLLCILNPAILFQVLLASRSSLDPFTDLGLYLGPMKFNVPAFAGILLATVGTVFLLTRALEGKRIRLTPVGIAFLLWLLVLPFWVFQAYSNYGSEGLVAVREWVRLLSLFIIFLITLNGTREWGISRMVRCLFFCLVVPLGVLMGELLVRASHVGRTQVRLSSTIAHPNALAIFLVFYLALTLWKLQTSSRKWPWRVLLGLEVIGLVATFSLNGILMLLVMIPILGLGSYRGKVKRYAFVVVLCTLFLFSFSRYGQVRINSLRGTPGFSEVMVFGNVTNSFTWRLYHWKLLGSEWLERPFIGYGLHMSGAKVSPWRADPHNDYLRYLVENGVVGGMFFYGLLGTIFLSLYSRVRKSQGRDGGLSLALVCFGVFCAWLIGSFAGNFITSTTFQYSFWALLGMVLSQDPEGVTASEIPERGREEEGES